MNSSTVQEHKQYFFLDVRNYYLSVRIYEFYFNGLTVMVTFYKKKLFEREWLSELF